MNQPTRPTVNLWSTLRDAINYKGGSCIPWTDLTAKVLDRSNVKDSVVRCTGKHEGISVHRWVQARIPEGSIIEVNGDEVDALLRAQAEKSGVRDFPSVAGKILAGYVLGHPGEEAVLDGTASQFFPTRPEELPQGYYGERQHAPYELRNMYEHGHPQEPDHEGKPPVR